MKVNFSFTYSKLIASLFILAGMFIGSYLGEAIDKSRNLKIFEHMEVVGLIEDKKERFENWSKSIEQIISNINTEVKKDIKLIQYKYFTMKWGLLAFISYILSCFLFYRLQESENT